MYAAVVTAFDQARPATSSTRTSTPRGSDEALIDVLVGLHPRVWSQADGSHYTSNKDLPLVPGIDGVRRTADGRLRYFILPDTSMGAFAQETVTDLRRTVDLPADTDPVQIAAAMNPRR